jgi:flagellin-like hook-associated protein FlgL
VCSSDLNDYPQYHRDRVMYSGDDNTILREISPNENMTVSVNGGATFGKTEVVDPGDPINGEKINVSTMFDNLILMRDILKAKDYTRPHALVDVGGVLQYVPLDQSDGTPVYPEQGYLETEYGTQQTWLSDIATVMADNGGRLKNLSDSIDRADKATLEIKSLLSQNEEVNMAEAISEVLNQEKIYQTVLNITGRTNNTLTLFDTLQ